jgi:hypothetical protein
MKCLSRSYLVQRIKLLTKLLKLRAKPADTVHKIPKSIPRLVAVRHKWDKYAISFDKATQLHFSTKQKQRRTIPLTPIPANQNPTEKWKQFAAYDII